MGSSGIGYSGISFLSISLGTGADSFKIASTPKASVIISANKGNDTINVQSTVAGSQTVISVGAGTVNLGSNAPLTGGFLDNLKGAISVSGTSATILNLDDTGSTIAKTGQLTGNAITGNQHRRHRLQRRRNAQH